MSGQWSFQDRRGMFQPGREVHEPSKRRSSQSSGGGGVVEAVRRASTSSNSDELSKTTSNTSATGTGIGTSNSPPPSGTGRRRSSNSTGLFGNLTTMKRGSADYGQKRESLTDTQTGGGAFSGWYNKTFRGVGGQEPAAGAGAGAGAGAAAQGAQERRGVME